VRVTTPGRLMVEQAVPPAFRDGLGELDEKSLKALATRIAKEAPEQYADFIGKISDVSRDAVYRYGREASVGLEDLKLPPELIQMRQRVRQGVSKILAGAGTSAQKQTKVIELLRAHIATIPKTLLEKLQTNGLALQTRSGARGNPNQLMQVVFGDVLVIDAQDKPVPVAVLHSYGEGVTPFEYWAASSGARKGSVSVQMSTAAGGYLGKQLSNLGHRIVVTKPDCGTTAGLPVDPHDEDNVGSVLATAVGKYPAGTVITDDMLDNLGDKPIRVRSLTTCALGDGVCSKCAGIRESGTFPAVGDHVGVVGTRALSEPITQAGLKCLHPETLVRMADWGVRALCEIKVGDRVMGADATGRVFPVNVTDVFHNGVRQLYDIIYAGNTLYQRPVLSATLDHKILQRIASEETLQILPAGHAQSAAAAVFEGPWSFSMKHPRITYYTRSEICSIGEHETMDIEVDSEDHLFLLANGLIVSNSKHSGGVAGSDDKQVSGFKEMNQFIQVPENFKGAATLSTVDGIVTGVKEAPAGGTYITVNDQQLYASRGLNPLVKPGDKVTAGDMLSEGIPNPADLIKYKGVGEARRYFVNQYRDILKRNGAAVHRRNIEATARGFIDRVAIEDPKGYNGYMIGDMVPYNQFAADYEPREGAETLSVGMSKGRYLEVPYLHYSLGTRVTPAVLADLRDNGVTEVVTHKNPPVFSPQVIRARSILASDPDWMTQLAGENLKKNLLEATRMGSSSTAEGTSYFPAMADPSKINYYKGGVPVAQPEEYHLDV